jgi:type VII secretion protein EccB
LQSRRDQIQAYSFTMGRLTSGVLRVDLDGPDEPVTRTSRGNVLGLILGLVAAVVVAIYGFVVPGGNTGWQKEGALVITKDSGARYLYTNGALYPVLNEASAKLVAGANMTVQTVESASLRGARRAAEFGIVGAPDSLPAPTSLTKGAWSACAVPQQDSAGATTGTQVVLRIGTPTAENGLTAGQAVLVTDPQGVRYLLWQGRRLRLGKAHAEAQALGYTFATPVPAPVGFLDAVPAGPDLVTPTIDGLGGSGPTLAGGPSRIGQLFSDVSNRHYVLTEHGLEPLTATLFALFRGDPTLQRKAYGGGVVDARSIGPSDLSQYVDGASAKSTVVAQGALLPRTPPQAADVNGQQAVCVGLQSGAGSVTSSLVVASGTDVLAGTLAPAHRSGIMASCHPADLVALRPGSGVLVAAAPAGGGAGTTPYLVTDDGVKYPIPSAAVVQQLGYEAASAVILPTTVLGLLPTGPSLNPTALANGGIVNSAASSGFCDGDARPYQLGVREGRQSGDDNQSGPTGVYSP